MIMPVIPARVIFNKSLEAVAPSNMIRTRIKRVCNTMIVDNKEYMLDNNVRVVGFGKAVAGMCRAIQEILGDHITRGVLSVPMGLRKTFVEMNKSDMLPLDDGKIEVCEGAKNNLPDEAAFSATLKIMDLLQQSTANDLIITLISGGGSALLCAPAPPLSLKEKLEVTNLLSNSGASIQELNIIRKNLSLVKGGGLAQLVYPAKMVTLILSDVVGDPLDLIASGPTVKNCHSRKDCIKILEKFDLKDRIPSSARSHLLDEEKGSGSNKVEDFSHIQNVLVGTNTIAINSAVTTAEQFGYQTFVLSNHIKGDAGEFGRFMVDLGLSLVQVMRNNSVLAGQNVLQCLQKGSDAWTKDLDNFVDKMSASTLQNKICVISAGETTVNVTGTGLGGRNQEMVLAAGIHYHILLGEDRETGLGVLNPSNTRVAFLSAGTDGQDGPTDAAGAVFDNVELWFLKNGEDLAKAKAALDNNDSHNFFTGFPGNLIKTGLTGTNVMDIQVMTVELICLTFFHQTCYIL